MNADNSSLFHTAMSSDERGGRESGSEEVVVVVTAPHQRAK